MTDDELKRWFRRVEDAANSAREEASRKGNVLTWIFLLIVLSKLDYIVKLLAGK